MENKQAVGVICQWCERVVRGGGRSLTLVTCLECARSFGASFRSCGRPIRGSTGSVSPTEERKLTTIH